MEFHEKLQALRKQKGLTQESLAEALFVSRTAVSKWEQGRGYPNIDSLKAISQFFGVTIDELLSGEELPIAQKDNGQRKKHIQDLIFGLLDSGVSMLCMLPFFGQKTDGMIQAVSLMAFTEIMPYLKAAYVVLVIGCVLMGMLTLVLQNYSGIFWTRYKTGISLTLNGAGVLLFIVSLQPYAAAFLFILLTIKVFVIKKTG